ncbi:MAG: phytoene desaturase family protein [Ilumatobacteraceae bacterium]|jgi:phytoene desaturase|nr:phytoene desaturase family protein [Ilumatobacteraceae bacterium]
MSRAVVVGGGVGGLAAAIRLRVAGHDVVLLERNAEPGGKLAVLERDGFSFDIGPSLVTLPHLFEEVLRLAGTSLHDEVELVRLDPQFRYVWPDGSVLVVPDDPTATAAAFDAFAPGAGDGWRRFESAGRRIWDVSERTFFAGPMSNPVDLARRMQRPSDLVAIDPLRSLRRAAASCFDDPRLVQWAGRYATYSGSAPDRAPATLACIPHIESRFGCWYPMGGLGRLRDALVRAAEHVGVELHTGVEVARVDADDRAVSGVVTASGDRVGADVVVANVDAEHLYADLLPDSRALRRVRRAERSTSGFVVCAGVEGTTPDVAHHTVWFAADPMAEFDGFRRGEVSDDPTIYACVSSVTDPSQAPAGHESWFLLVNVPQGAAIEREAHAELVLDRLAERGTDIGSRVRFVETLTPADLARRYRAPGGAIYGTSSNGRRAAFVRPGNRGARQGLYLVGGSSHPGGGLPLVLMSARIVADLVAADHRAGRSG